MALNYSNILFRNTYNPEEYLKRKEDTILSARGGPGKEKKKKGKKKVTPRKIQKP